MKTPMEYLREQQERYSEVNRPVGIGAYDETLRSFQERGGLSAIGWSPAVLNRLGSVRALNGRDRLVEHLRALGFALK